MVNLLHYYPPSLLSDNWFQLVSMCCIACVTCIIFIISGRRRKRLQPSLPPGPTGLPVVGMLPFLDPQLHTYFTRLAQTYGPMMSLQLGKKTAIVVTSPWLAKQMLENLGAAFANHDVTEAGRELSYGGNNILFATYGPEWRMLKKVSLHGMLGPSALDAGSNIRRQCLRETILQLEENAGYPVNIGEQMFQTVLNVITRSTMGKRSAEMAKDVAEFRREVDKAFELVGAPNVSDFFPGLARFDLQRIAKKARDCSKRLDCLMDLVIDERIKMNAKESNDKDDVDDRKDFLQFLLQSKDKCDKNTRITMSQIKGVLTDMILAGTDTTSRTLEFAMAEIMNTPEVMRKAREELEAVVEAGNPLEESHTYKLPYFHAIMKETLRLHPTVPLLAPYHLKESCVVGGYTIPKGSFVVFNVWAIHRDPSLWEDPLEFKPERFLDGGHDFSSNNLAYFPFGSGRRICFGIALAERMILLSLASLVHYFDWNLPVGVEELDLSEKFGSTLKKATPLLLIPSSRSSYIHT